MKRAAGFLTIVLSAVMLSACTPSNIKSEETMPMPEDALEVSKDDLNKKAGYTKESKEAYTIPDDAPEGVDGGPGMMETQAEEFDKNYPEDKKNVADAASAQGNTVCIYSLDYTGVYQSFDVLETCDADSLVAAMVSNGVLDAGTTVEEFSSEGKAGVLKLNQLKGVYSKAKDEQLVACITNTFIDNLALETLEIKVGDTSYGVNEFTSEYDAT
ncbi:MAG: hypothetical protein Q4B86_07510 [Eubacteriales bacterium]|nr:hypothetical protein [Eubacteriales bacterium]